MKVEWKVDVWMIVTGLILSVAAVGVAKIMAPKRYVPMSAPVMWANQPTGLYLDTERGDVGLGPIFSPTKPALEK